MAVNCVCCFVATFYKMKSLEIIITKTRLFKYITKTRLFKYTENLTAKTQKFSDKKNLIFFLFLLKT